MKGRHSTLPSACSKAGSKANSVWHTSLSTCGVEWRGWSTWLVGWLLWSKQDAGGLGERQEGRVRQLELAQRRRPSGSWLDAYTQRTRGAHTCPCSPRPTTTHLSARRLRSWRGQRPLPCHCGDCGGGGWALVPKCVHTLLPLLPLLVIPWHHSHCHAHLTPQQGAQQAGHQRLCRAAPHTHASRVGDEKNARREQSTSTTMPAAAALA